jgi:hypothetical protein
MSHPLSRPTFVPIYSPHAVDCTSTECGSAYPHWYLLHTGEQHLVRLLPPTPYTPDFGALELTASRRNLSILMALDGEPGWVCLICCNCDSEHYLLQMPLVSCVRLTALYSSVLSSSDSLGHVQRSCRDIICAIFMRCINTAQHQWQPSWQPMYPESANPGCQS